MTDYNDEDTQWYFGIPFKKRVSGTAAAKPEPKFKVGDRVRVVKNGWDGDGSWHCAGIGETDTVVGFDNYQGRERVEGEEWFYHYDEIELVTAAPFAVGDRVKLKRHFGPHARGDEGKVYGVEATRFGYDVGASMDPYGIYSVFPAECLELAGAADCAERKEQHGGEDEPKFKAGDVVRAIYSCDSGGFIAGRLYEVSSAYREGDRFRIKVALDSCGSTENGWGVENFEPSFTLPIIQPAIVARVLDGQPRPSNIPYMHADSGAALLEAERLAKNNPGQEFAVYQRVGARVAEVQYNMKEVA